MMPRVRFLPLPLVLFLVLSCTARSGSAPEQENLTREQVLGAPDRYITVGEKNCDFRTLREAIEQVRPEKHEIVLMDPLHTEAGTIIDRDLVLRGFGAGATILQAAPGAEQAAERVLQIEKGVTVLVSGLTIRNGNPPGPYRCGGGIRNYGNLTLESCAVRDNTAVYGAGILNDGVLSLHNCTVADNHTLPMTMAELQDATGCTGSGGGIKNEAHAHLELCGSTISGNSSLRKGGGVFLACESSARLSNCTISGNDSRQPGGGIHIRGDLEMIHCTVTGNRSVEKGGGIYNLGHLDMTGSIIALNERSDFVMGSGGGIYGQGELATNAYNLIADGGLESCLSGDPELGPLADNGGPTRTHALRRRSPARDAIPPADLLVRVDQRGRPRQGKAGDLGAFER